MQICNYDVHPIISRDDSLIHLTLMRKGCGEVHFSFSEKGTCFPTFEGVVAQWCNPLTLQPEQSGGSKFDTG